MVYGIWHAVLDVMVVVVLMLVLVWCSVAAAGVVQCC